LKEVGCGIGAVIAAVVAVFALSIGIWVFRVQTADIKGRGDAEIQRKSGAARISQYNYFFDLCVSVQNAESAIDAEYNRLENTTDPYQKDVIQTNISAQQTTRMNGINTYNADAKKGYTSGQFLSSSLPYQLDTAPYEPGGPKTQCAA
jgi:hypothetical protein